MDIVERMDEQHAAVLEMIPADLLDLSDIPTARQVAAELLEQMADQFPEIEGVATHDRQAPGPDGDPAVPVRIYRPEDAQGSLPAMLWIHGGGMVLGNIDQDDLFCKAIAKDVNCAVVSVEYQSSTASLPNIPFLLRSKTATRCCDGLHRTRSRSVPTRVASSSVVRAPAPV